MDGFGFERNPRAEDSRFLTMEPFRNDKRKVYLQNVLEFRFNRPVTSVTLSSAPSQLKSQKCLPMQQPVTLLA